MGSRQQITLILACIISHQIYESVSAATKENRHEKRREYQYQHSSQIIGSHFVPGFYNNESGQYEEINSDLDNWMQHNREQVAGMADKLRYQYNATLSNSRDGSSINTIRTVNNGGDIGGTAADGYYTSSGSNKYANYVRTTTNSAGTNANCNICAFLSTATGKTQEELDAIAKNMTIQILADMKTGKLARNQINQPNWFENRVAQTLEELNKQHQQIDEINRNDSDNGGGGSNGDVVYTRGPIHQSVQRYGDTRSSTYDSKDLQQSQQNVFNTNSGYYQGQSQSQQSFQSNSVYPLRFTTTTKYPTIPPLYRQWHPAPNVTINRQTQTNEEAQQQQHNIQINASTSPVLTRKQENRTRQTNIDARTRIINDNTTQRIAQNKVNIVDIHTPTPIPETNSRHSIYAYMDASEILPNYQPRVILNQTTQFHDMDYQRHDKEYRGPQIYTQTQYNLLQIPDTTSEFKSMSQTFDNKNKNIQTQQQHTINQLNPVPNTNYKINTEYSWSGVVNHNHVTPLSTQTMYQITCTDDEYRIRLRKIQDELSRLGYENLSDREYNVTIASGGFIHNGYKYIYNKQNNRYEKGDRIEITNAQYHSVLDLLRNKLKQDQHKPMTEAELNQTILTGVYIRDGYKWTYNSETDRYDRYQMKADEQEQILNRIKEILNRYGYRQMTQKECNDFLQNGYLTRAGHNWIYNYKNGTLSKSEHVGDDLVELNQLDYERLYKIIMDTLEKHGYNQLNLNEINKTISSGIFERNGIKWMYNPQTEQFDKMELNQEEYADRVNILISELNRLGYKHLSPAEYREIIYNGQFYNGGYRYEYNSNYRHYDRVELNENEYGQRLRSLREQLKYIDFGSMSASEENNTLAIGQFNFKGFNWKYNPNNGLFEKQELTDQQFEERIRLLQQQLRLIGYGVMSKKDCRKTIESGEFHYGGYRWVYNPTKRYYEIISRSKEEDDYINPTIPSQNLSIGNDQNKSTINPNNTPYAVYRPPQPIISKNRGDQPPQNFDDDYVSEEIFEQEPGIGYYPIDKKPEIRLASPRTMNFAEQQITQINYMHQTTTTSSIKQQLNLNENQGYAENESYNMQVIIENNRQQNGNNLEDDNVYQRRQIINNKLIELQQPKNYRNSIENPIENLINNQTMYNSVSPIFSRQTRNSSQQKQRSVFDVQSQQNSNDLQQMNSDIFQHTEDLTQQLLDLNNNFEDFGQQQQQQENIDLQIVEELQQNQNATVHSNQIENFAKNDNIEEIQAKVIELPKEENKHNFWQKMKNLLFG